MHICYDKDGNSYAGEIKSRKNEQKKSKAKEEKRQIEESKNLLASLLELQKHFNSNYHT